MATKRRPPTKKQPSPPPPAPDDQLEEDERSSSEDDPDESASDDEDEDSDEDDSGSPPARPTPNPPRAPVVAASAVDSEEDGDGESDESDEEDSGSEEGKPGPSLQKSSIARPDANGKPSHKKPDPVSESEEEDSESEEEESDPTPVNVAARPVSAIGNPAGKKSLPESESDEEDSESEEEQQTQNLRGSVVASPADAKGTPFDKESVPVSKSGKVTASSPKSAMGDTPKKLFQRIWSDDDQIALLQGMVEYVDEKGKEPGTDIKDFWLFIRDKLSFPVTELQLMTKIKSVRKKYRSNHQKDRAFSKVYDAKVFDLSKKIWDAAKKNPAAVKKNKAATENGENGGAKKRKIAPSDKEAVWDSPGQELTEHMLWKDGFVDLCREHFGWDEYLAWAKVNSMDESEMKSFEPLWKKLKTEEIGIFERRRLLEFDSLGTIF